MKTKLDITIAFNDYLNKFALSMGETCIELGVIDFDKKVSKPDAVNYLIPKAVFAALRIKILHKIKSIELSIITDGFWDLNEVKKLIKEAKDLHNVDVVHKTGNVESTYELTLLPKAIPLATGIRALNFN